MGKGSDTWQSETIREIYVSLNQPNKGVQMSDNILNLGNRSNMSFTYGSVRLLTNDLQNFVLERQK